MDTTKDKKMGYELSKIANTDCETLSIWSFYKVMETQDLTYLLKDKHAENVPDLNETWDNIIEEYQELTNSANDMILWRLRLEIGKLSLRLQRVTIGCKIYFHSEVSKEVEKEIIDNLKSDNVLLKGRTVEELDRINRQIQSMKTKISLKELELKQLTPSNDETQDIYEQIYLIGKITDAKYKLDPKETSVKEFVILSKHATKESNGKR
jgi:hypothetical protein